jgi:YjbE family integral membrane protein
MQSTLSLLLAALQVVGIDILLSSDNAVVIALACRGLPERQRRQGVLYGAAGAVVLRIALVFVSLSVLSLPGLKMAAAGLLVWIGIKLVMPSDDEDTPAVKPSDRLWAAVRTVVMADLIMSFDNIAAVAGIAEGSGEHRLLIVGLGLLCSIPLVVWGSQTIMKWMARFPWLVKAGGLLLGWVAGSLAATDPLLSAFASNAFGDRAEFSAGLCGALLVAASIVTFTYRKQP